MKSNDFDVIVIGGGHAGVEAAAAAARLGASTALVTFDLDKIGVMSCNPAIGGVGKGHLVREIDALDGIMGRAIDQAGIQFRVLNASKGPAVRGPRAQADRKLYRVAVQRLLAEQSNLSCLAGEVVGLILKERGPATSDTVRYANGVLERQSVAGVVLADGQRLRAKSVVLTTGTFLGGTIHVGAEVEAAGRVGEAASQNLARFLRSLDLPIGRLKTGTPARLNGKTINWSQLEMQAADENPLPFSYLTDRIRVPQIACGITYTNPHTHKIIQNNKHLSAIYSGQIASKGPRYCPSIEDKVTRFADKDRHQVFLEPEGLDVDTVYPNGISTSLPRDVQLAYIRSIVGLEQVEIEEYGYAVEYDYIDPRALNDDLSLKACQGLFLAGQINGTTGYEEAGGQGLLAGANAALLAEGLARRFTLARHESYIGVMIDDLITRGAPEPYRMFTSRAEFRLSLRPDNADQRLTAKAVALGLASETRCRAWSAKAAALQDARHFCESQRLTPQAWQALGFETKLDGQRRSIADMASVETHSIAQLKQALPALERYDDAILEQIKIDALYAGYIKRQTSDIRILESEAKIKLPPDFPYSEVGSLSGEELELLTSIRPQNLSQASRIPGVTPHALIAIMRHLKRA